MALFKVNPAHLHYNEIQHARLFWSFSPKLARIHVGLHCNGNEKTPNREKGYWSARLSGQERVTGSVSHESVLLLIVN